MEIDAYTAHSSEIVSDTHAYRKRVMRVQHNVVSYIYARACVCVATLIFRRLLYIRARKIAACCFFGRSDVR